MKKFLATIAIALSLISCSPEAPETIETSHTYRVYKNHDGSVYINNVKYPSSSNGGPITIDNGEVYVSYSNYTVKIITDEKIKSFNVAYDAMEGENQYSYQFNSNTILIKNVKEYRASQILDIITE